ncbi:MAG: copper homeostasis protein CutC [Phycisphaerales bacterium]|nr:copper homeostasis protein CutC [Phycisphaerales bacterium]
MSDLSRVILEIAVDSVVDALAAEACGADRLELCARLDVGGLTPRLETFQAVRQGVACPVLVMIRCRAGGFVYAEDELEQMAGDAAALRGRGADGFVFGALTTEGEVDARACRRLVAASRGRPAVFHRAFDEARDPFAALEALVSLGFSRVLTSGRSACAADAEALTLLRRLREQAGGRIEILPGGGVRPHHVEAIVAATGCTQVHSSARRRDPRTGAGRFDANLVAELRRTLDGGGPLRPSP